MLKSFIDNEIENIDIKFHNSVGEIIPEHYELLIDNESIIFIYKTIACYSYNTITVNKKPVNMTDKTDRAITVVQKDYEGVGNIYIPMVYA